ncbi:hypothetical protein K1719_008383 [Acacia pycnantha]|nr:hypothetical protein K1719_008383 [Acacia pycnantha]
MGQSFKKATSAGNDFVKKKEDIMRERYNAFLKDNEELLKDNKDSNKIKSEFYRAICLTVEELNRAQGYTQVKTIEESTLRDLYNKCGKDGTGRPTEDDFVKMMATLEHKLEFTAFGVKETLLYIFGVPASATFIKNALMPSLVSNEVLIPSMTSLTVLVLTKLNKI